MGQKEKKPRSAAQIAHSQKLAAAAKERAAKAKLEVIATPETPVIPAPLEELPGAPIATSPFQALPAEKKDALIIELMTKMTELLAANQNNVIPTEKKVEEIARIQGVNISAQNGVQGQVFKYPVDKGFYPDPTDRLLADPKLKRFAMQENFIFKWDVTGETYEKYGITYTEPRFTVELYRHHFDPETGEKTRLLQLVSRCILHEDEFVATVTANELGFTDQFSSKEELMDEVRYHRIRHWLLDTFMPPTPQSFKKKPNSIVVNGTVVEVVDSEVIMGEDAADSKAAFVQSQVRF